MFEPFDYQQDCLERTQTARLAGKKKGLVVMASGLGKTVTSAFDYQQWSQTNNGRFMYLCDQNDILYQARTTFQEVLGSSAKFGYFHGQEKKVHGMDGVFASFQTMEKHFNAFDPKEFPHIIVDESHHSHAETYKSVIDYFQPEWLGGYTATPDRMDGQDIRDIYGPELFYLPLEIALANGLLTPVDYRLLTNEVDIENLKRQGRKLTIQEINERISAPKADEEIAAIIARHASEFAEPRVIVFTSSIDRCNQFCEHVPGSLAIHSRLSTKERNVRTELFRQGLASTAVTVDAFNEGIDIPQANVLAFLRLTESRNIFDQQLGRGLRRFQGKDRVIVLDFVANCERIKMVQSLWKKVATERKKSESAKGPRWRRVRSASISPDLQVDKLQFSEKVVQVLDLLNTLRPKYISEILRLAKEYSEKNTTPANRVYARSPSLLWWHCAKCDYEWQTSGARRLRGSKCPACDGKVVTAENNLAFCYPQLESEYSSKNELPATQVTPRSSHPFVWQCADPECGYEWIEMGASRVRRFLAGSGCPDCFERSSLNTLSIEHPELFAEYSERNTLPSPVPWWKCSDCGFEWRGRTAARLKGVGCRVCAGKIVTDETRLELVCPSLAAELLTPGMAHWVSVHSDRTHKWLCPYCSHQWWSSPKQRMADRSCPRCDNPKRQGATATGPSVAEDPLLLKEYSRRNLVLAERVPQESHEPCWWSCSLCAFTYMVSPQERVHEGAGCPVCAALKTPFMCEEVPKLEELKPS